MSTPADTANLTHLENRVLDCATRAIGRGRGSITTAYVAQALDLSTRQASGALNSLSRKGALRAIADGFVRRTFYVLP